MKKQTLQTTLTVKEIEEMIINNPLYFNIRTDVAIPNLSWSLLNYEADLIIMNKTGYITEFEIKRSFEDLKHEFTKRHFHNSELIYSFYYVLPKTIEEKALKLFDEHLEDENYVRIFGKSTEIYKKHPAVIWYEDDGKMTTNDGSPYLWGKHRKLFLEEKVTLLRMLNIRYWNLRRKEIEK